MDSRRNLNDFSNPLNESPSEKEGKWRALWRSMG